MSMARVFALGVILLALGAQLRMVDTFVLNEETTKIVNKQVARFDKPPAKASADPFAPPPTAAAAPSKRSVSPPRWLSYSFLSIGAILVCTCPLRR